MAVSATNAAEVWEQALVELEGQTTRATFDTLLRGTTCRGVDGDALLVVAKNRSSAEWLSLRLAKLVNRTLHRITGNGTYARFVLEQGGVSEDEGVVSPDGPEIDGVLAAELEVVLREVVDPATRQLLQQRIAALSAAVPVSVDEGEASPEFDCYGRGGGGFYPVSNYADVFWKPLLKKRKAFLVYTSLRSMEKKPRGDWTTMRHVSIRELCERVPCSRNTLLGETRKGVRVPGAFDILRDEGLARLDIFGEGRHTTYRVSVRIKLPLLTPGQAARLPGEVQVRHIQWLQRYDIDSSPWVGCQKTALMSKNITVDVKKHH